MPMPCSRVALRNERGKQKKKTKKHEERTRYEESVRKSGVIPYIYDSIVRMSRWFRFCSNETLKFCESYPLGGLGWLLVLKAVHCSTPDFLTLS